MKRFMLVSLMSCLLVGQTSCDWSWKRFIGGFGVSSAITAGSALVGSVFAGKEGALKAASYSLGALPAMATLGALNLGVQTAIGNTDQTVLKNRKAAFLKSMDDARTVGVCASIATVCTGLLIHKYGLFS